MQGLKGYSFRSSFVLGFHGCDATTARNILLGKSQHLRSSANSYDWLGHGIYFWEVSPSRAIQWAQEAMVSTGRASPIRKPAVIGAVIDLGNCLDSLDSQNFEIVRDAYEGLKDVVEASRRPMPQNRSVLGRSDKCLRNLDCSVINYVHSMRTEKRLAPFDTVRAAFIEGSPIYEGGSFYDRNHIQICVRNRECIKGYFRPIVPPS
jgi:hypothetical protein